ncbi:hypothetical protein DPMN_030264 [Dreissena polymorpha]|uniref:Uncharacterized protein n=1 Tax=Dreissena polymorpha TaxID=45954 RepID=A0A9D4M0K2_DREPO|nr:hypothetical protein DPMN_030264 [Dreissena polymorpha]
MTLLTMFNEDRTINVAPIPYIAIKRNAPPLGSHTNLLAKFHEDLTINVASRVLTRNNAPPPGSHVFKATETIFELIQDIIRTNRLTKFHEDRKINVASRVKNAPPPKRPCFSTNRPHF